jgi:hypothetical protein
MQQLAAALEKEPLIDVGRLTAGAEPSAIEAAVDFINPLTPIRRIADPFAPVSEKVMATVSLALWPVVGMFGSGARAAASGAGSYVYQLVDDAGEAVYYGITENPLVRLGAHSRLPPGPFRGMQVISEALPLAQAQALETSLIQQALSEGRFLYNVAERSISEAWDVAVPAVKQATQTLLNRKVYP